MKNLILITVCLVMLTGVASAKDYGPILYSTVVAIPYTEDSLLVPELYLYAGTADMVGKYVWISKTTDGAAPQNEACQVVKYTPSSGTLIFDLASSAAVGLSAVITEGDILYVMDAPPTTALIRAALTATKIATGVNELNYILYDSNVGDTINNKLEYAEDMQEGLRDSLAVFGPADARDLLDTLSLVKAEYAEQMAEDLRDTLDARTGYLGISGAQIDTMATPDGSATPWTAGASHRMFTITNSVYIHAIYGVVRETLTELAAACTIELGVAGATAGLIALTDPPTTLAAGDIWTNSTTASLVPLGTPSDGVLIPFTTDIDLTVGGVGATDDVNDGIITIVVIWSPAPPLIGGGAGDLAPAVWD